MTIQQIEFELTEHIIDDGNIHLILIGKGILDILTHFLFELIFLVVSALVEVEIIEDVELLFEVIQLHLLDVLYLVLLDDLLTYQILGLGYSLQILIVQLDCVFIITGEIEQFDIIGQQSIEEEGDSKQGKKDEMFEDVFIVLDFEDFR